MTSIRKCSAQAHTQPSQRGTVWRMYGPSSLTKWYIQNKQYSRLQQVEIIKYKVQRIIKILINQTIIKDIAETTTTF